MSFLHSKNLVMSSMLLREQYKRTSKRMQPQMIKKLVRITQAPAPLEYKLHPYEEPLSLMLPHAPPKRPIEPLPFHVERSTSGNLPVYIKYTEQHQIKRTIIRKVTGDVEAFAKEVKKIVSNAEVRVKVGKIQIPGVHKESVQTWLFRLGL